MFRQQALLISNLLILGDGISFITGGYLSWYIYWKMTWETFEISSLMFLLMVLVLILLNAFVLGLMGMYDDKILPKTVECALRLGAGVVLEFGLLHTIIVSSGIYPIPLDFLLLYMALVFAGLLFNRLLAKIWLDARNRNPRHMRRILLAGSENRVAVVLEALKHQHSWGHHVVGWLSFGPVTDKIALPHLGDFDALTPTLYNEALDDVIVALPHDAPIRLHGPVELCRQLGVTIHIVPGMFNPTEQIRGLTVQHIKNVPTLTVYGSAISPSGLFYKRILDIAGGLVGFSIFLLLYPLIGLAIKLNSPGPVLFKQTRVGLNNRHFKLYKFRSMRVDAEERKKELSAFNEMDGQMFKMKNDPRVTRVGRFLRKTSLDEFPQFINVLKGDMSMVGTRPPTPEEVMQYEPWQRRRISMKPGITGIWQISGRNNIKNFQDVVKYDLEYIDDWHFSRDLYILLKTLWVVLAGKGAS